MSRALQRVPDSRIARESPRARGWRAWGLALLAVLPLLLTLPDCFAGSDREAPSGVTHRPPADTDPKEALRQILSTEEFQYSETHVLWREQLMLFVYRVVRAIVRLFGGLSPGAMSVILIICNVIVWTALIAMIIALLILLAYYLRNRLRARRGAIATVRELATRRLESPNEYLRRVPELIAQGEYRLALHCLYLAVVCRLELADLVRYDRSKTNWEYFRAASRRLADAEAVGQLRELNAEYDRQWYGLRECSRNDVESFQSLVCDFLGNV